MSYTTGFAYSWTVKKTTAASNVVVHFFITNNTTMGSIRTNNKNNLRFSHLSVQGNLFIATSHHGPKYLVLL